VTKQTYRHRAGIILGAVLGLVFGILSQGVNPILLPGIDLYQPPFGSAGNILLAFAVGAGLGLLCAWMEPSVPAVLSAAAVGAVLMLAAAFFTGSTPLMEVPVSTIGFIFLFVPFTGMLIPVLWLVRTTINTLTDSRLDKQTLMARWWLPLLVITAAGAIGWSLVYSVPARTVLTHNQQMLQQGLTASSMALMPAPLLGPEMEDFSSHSSQEYTLAWDNKRINAYAIPRTAAPEYLMSVVIARFDNGWNVVCLYPTAESQPRCRSFDELP